MTEDAKKMTAPEEAEEAAEKTAAATEEKDTKAAPEAAPLAPAKGLTILQPGAVSEEEEDEDPETPYLASDMYQRLVALINNFESGLPDDMQAGGRLVSAGDITFSIQDIGYWDPNMIVFYGELSDGSAVELVQHISQLNLLLVAVPRKDDIQKPRRVIGFNQKNEPDIAEDDSE